MGRGNKLTRGFTIVELLIVIVVIAILAAIVIVAYNGIQQRAREATIKADLSNAAKKMAIDNTLNGSYPLTAAAVDGGKGLPASSGTTYQFHSTGSTYCITGTNGTSTYTISDTATTPTSGGCAGDGVGGVGAVTNLVINPSFEVDPGGWNSDMKNGDTSSISTAQANSGTHSMALTITSSGNDSYLECYINLQPGTYTVSGYVRLPNNGATFSNRDAMFYSVNGLSSVPNTVAYNRSVINQWQRVSAVFTTTTAGQLGVRFYGPVGTTYVDSIMVTQGSSVPGYADGSSPNWIWNGTANSSTSTGPAQ
jgi:prepilin-type N-terminal cleavage/methylation domain-containing protein